MNADDSVGLTIVGDSSAIDRRKRIDDFSAGTVETTGAGGLTIGGAFGNAGYLIAERDRRADAERAQVNTGGGIVETMGSGSVVLEKNAAISTKPICPSPRPARSARRPATRTTSSKTKVLNTGAVNVANNSTLVADDHWTGAGAVNLNWVERLHRGRHRRRPDWYLLGGGTIDLPEARREILSGAGASSTNGTLLLNKGATRSRARA